MRYFFVIALCAFFSVQCFAQPTPDTFAPYRQPIPGSALDCHMIPVPGGRFSMGSPAQDRHKKTDETPQRTVTISPFWMSAYEVTRDAFDVFFKDESTSQNSAVDAVTRPSPQYIDFSLGMGKEGGYPVNSLSQYAALMYCRWLYDKTGIFYRLPTEAEWEYAARAGTNSPYFFGTDTSLLDSYAWYAGNSGGKFQKVGQKKPNAWGLYDMLGNMSEWTLDHYDEKYLENMADNSVDPKAPASTAKYPKTLRGGSYADDANGLRVANRLPSDPVWNRRDPQIPRSKWWITDAPFTGFRIIRPLAQPTADAVNQFFKQYLGK